MSGGARRITRRRALVGALIATSVAVSGCVYGPDQNLGFRQLAEKAYANNTLPWFCQSSGEGGHHGQTGGPADVHYAGKKKGVLTKEQCLSVADFFDAAMSTAKQYPTRGAAKAHLNRLGQPGFLQAVQFVPGLGTHDLIADVSLSGFDPKRPMFFQYDGSGDDAKLAGLSWFVQQPAGVTTPPEGFPGDNDMWHTHASLCYRNGTGGTVVGNEISDEECARRGGTNRGLPGVWMIHAWILPGYENVYDVFSGAYACVKGTGPVADNDPCKAVHADPEHGNPTTTATTAPGTTLPGTPPPTTTTTVMDHGNHDH
jgi:hypothetical protein